MAKYSELIRVIGGKIDFDAKSFIREGSRIIFVYNLLPDEVADIRLYKRQHGMSFGIVEKLISKSADRISNEILGGSKLSHLSIPKQLEWQEYTTRLTFNKIGKFAFKLSPIIHNDNTENYRNKTVFHVLNKEYLDFGVYDINNNLVEVNDYIIASLVANKIKKSISDARLKVPAGIIKHLVIRSNLSNQALVTLVATNDDFDYTFLLEVIRSNKEVIGVTINYNEESHQILGKKSKVLYGNNEITMTTNKKNFIINDRSFYQVNDKIPEIIHQKIASFLDLNEPFIDAYCGVGTIGISIAKEAKVIFIDNNKENIKMLKKNIKANNIINYEIYSEDIIKVLDDLPIFQLILDPPYTGLDIGLLAYIWANKYQKIVYLSCNPRTLARDLQKITNFYRIVEVIPFRMFPHTTAIETLVFLELIEDSVAEEIS